MSDIPADLRAVLDRAYSEARQHERADFLRYLKALCFQAAGAARLVHTIVPVKDEYQYRHILRLNELTGLIHAVQNGNHSENWPAPDFFGIPFGPEDPMRYCVSCKAGVIPAKVEGIPRCPDCKARL